ncbi:ImmA/IrrE family metallo-endopeptidase [Leptospira paudalimensis]|uniref:ImmA/IrrE family metallo-endopeptidase n=1 Tax=Leptospira paudalimensis TaxID=2950024 RepID=A0ABT3M671_9LEPT|nr:ImmA/IrrE family metallo-endopeptidase [Leptospira paudalimensis]MCW7503887.1 ImmA/IrrE family metallo-endopeptidase [Leptospira paudalimensis]
MSQSRFEYYESLKVGANKLREKYEIKLPRVLPGEIKKIMKSEGIKEINYWKDFRDLRGAYIVDDGIPHVVVNKNLRRDQKTFTLAHELKHHLFDRNLGSLYCTNANINEQVEIGAEVFAAELLFPDQLYLYHLNEMGVTRNNFTPAHLVLLKNATDTTLSYAGLAKKAEFLQIAEKGSLCKIKWLKLRDEILGERIYRRSA